jgi:hypothetical protein
MSLNIFGRFLGQYLGLTHDDEVGTATLSELIEMDTTYRNS